MEDKALLKKRIQELLVDFLPVYQRIYAKGKCYEYLMESLVNFWSSKNDSELKEVLKLAKENFDHYCKMEIDGYKKEW